MENKEKEKAVITYDYKTVNVRREMETMTTDAYENLGWELVGSGVPTGSIFHVILSFKRDRKIADKQNLLKLQDKVDGALLNIEHLQNKKKSAGMVAGLSTGIAGTLTFGGGLSMVMVLGETLGFMIGGIALGIVGVGIALLAFPILKKVKRNRIAKIEPLLENEFNRLSDVCEEAKK